MDPNQTQKILDNVEFVAEQIDAQAKQLRKRTDRIRAAARRRRKFRAICRIVGDAAADMTAMAGAAGGAFLLAAQFEAVQRVHPLILPAIALTAAGLWAGILNWLQTGSSNGDPMNLPVWMWRWACKLTADVVIVIAGILTAEWARTQTWWHIPDDLNLHFFTWVIGSFLSFGLLLDLISIAEGWFARHKALCTGNCAPGRARKRA